MADIELVIKMPEELYETYKDRPPMLGDTGMDMIAQSIANGTPLPKCNECKYYEGVHKVQGHAPCNYHTIGGVMWDWYCSQFETLDLNT